MAQLGGAEKHHLLPGPRTAVDELEQRRSEHWAYQQIAVLTPQFAYLLDEFEEREGVPD